MRRALLKGSISIDISSQLIHPDLYHAMGGASTGRMTKNHIMRIRAVTHGVLLPLAGQGEQGCHRSALQLASARLQTSHPLCPSKRQGKQARVPQRLGRA